MKKSIILSILLMSSPLWAAVSANAIWEIRTTGGNDHSGGYCPDVNATGTDYSKQADPQYDITNGNAAGAGAVLTTASASADMNDNILYLVGGTHCTAGWYEIIKVSAGVSITLDRNFITDVGHGDVHIHIGGAWAFGGSLDDEFFEAKVAGQKIWIKAGNYAVGEHITIATDGSITLPIVIEGYNISRGDAPAGTDRPLIAIGTYNFSWGGSWNFYNIRTTSADYTFGLSIYSLLMNSKIQNTKVTASAAVTLSAGTLVNCEVTSTAGVGISTTGVGVKVSNCYIHNCGTNGITGGYNNLFVTGSVISTCPTTGIVITAGIYCLVTNNTIYNCGTGISGTTGYVGYFVNNIIDSCTIGASWTTQTNSNFWDYNCWSNNGTDVSKVTKGPHDITADALLNAPATGDFTLGTGSPAFNAGLKLGASVGL